MRATGGAAAQELLASWAGAGASAAPRPSLLKRSIILAKAWCYYETRILGAHHSLLSSYALEVFVLYVLLHYHHAANTPLGLLCTFIEVVRGFDWQAHALSLHGAVPLTALPAAPDIGALTHCSTHLGCQMQGRRACTPADSPALYSFELLAAAAPLWCGVQQSS